MYVRTNIRSEGKREERIGRGISTSMYFFGDKRFVFVLILVYIGYVPVYGLVCTDGECRQLPYGETCEQLEMEANYVCCCLSVV